MPSAPLNPQPRSLVDWMKLSREIGDDIILKNITNADTAQAWCDAHRVHPDDFREAIVWWQIALDIGVREQRLKLAAQITTRPPFK